MRITQVERLSNGLNGNHVILSKIIVATIVLAGVDTSIKPAIAYSALMEKFVKYWHKHEDSDRSINE